MFRRKDRKDRRADAPNTRLPRTAWLRAPAIVLYGILAVSGTVTAVLAFMGPAPLEMAPDPGAYLVPQRERQAGEIPPADRDHSGTGKGPPLAPALPALMKPGPHGNVPAIGPGGRKPHEVYRRPFVHGEERHLVAIILGDVGLSDTRFHELMDEVPPEVTLAFSSYTAGLQEKVDLARRLGHEVVLQVPMQGSGYPSRENPGPYALLNDLSDTANIDSLERVLSRGHGAVGIVNPFGDVMAGSTKAMEPVLKYLHRAGLIYIDTAGNSPGAFRLAMAYGVPVLKIDMVIDASPSVADVRDALRRLDDIAGANYVAVGYARPYPSVVGAIREWLGSARPVDSVLAPVSVIPGRQQEYRGI